MKETKCALCGKTLTKEDTHTHRGKGICNQCYEDNTVFCDCCGTRVWYDEVEGNDNTRLCYSCYNNNYTHCEQCGTLIHNEAAFYFNDSDYPYCNECYDELNDIAIKEYGYKPEPIFYGSGDLFMGIELEIDDGGESNDNADKILRIGNMSDDHIYCKHDGSLDNGFEIVSHPMTLEYHTNNMPWEEIMEKAKHMGYNSHRAGTCGLHIHVNRNAFGERIEDQDATIARIVYFVEKHWNELLKFSRRTEDAMRRWASRYGISHNTEDTYKKAKDKRMGRYVAVNLDNFNTIEFRMFRGTLRYSTFVATLQLVNKICELAKFLTDEELERLSWSDIMLNLDKNKYPELISYLKTKRLYVNEEV